MTTLSARRAKFNVNESTWKDADLDTLKSIHDALSDWIDYNEESMTEKQFDRAIEIKSRLERVISERGI